MATITTVDFRMKVDCKNNVCFKGYERNNCVVCQYQNRTESYQVRWWVFPKQKSGIKHLMSTFLKCYVKKQ